MTSLVWSQKLEPESLKVALCEYNLVNTKLTKKTLQLLLNQKNPLFCLLVIKEGN